MANYNAFAPNNSSSNGASQASNPVEVKAQTQESNMWVWGEVPETRHLIVETTLSSNSFTLPILTEGKGKVANVWPGALYWTTKGMKQAGYRLFMKLNAMVLERNDNGIPKLDEENEFIYKDGAQFLLRTLTHQLPDEVKAQIKMLEGAKVGKADDPVTVAAIDEALATLKSKGTPVWRTKDLDSRSFVAGLVKSETSLNPTLMYFNFPFKGKLADAFVKEIAKLQRKGEPGLLRIYLPMERLSLPKEKWEPVKVSVNGQTVEMKDPRTGKTVMGPVFSWGNQTQPIARVELVFNKFLPSSQGMDRVLSIAETTERLNLMQREWESSDEGEFALWQESLRAKFGSNGNRWAMKAGALPVLTMGQYAPTCTFWEDAKASPAKFDKWAEKLQSFVGVKPRLDQEKGKGLGDKFSQAACDAIIASAQCQSISPWTEFVGKPAVVPTATPAVTPVTPVVPQTPPAPVKPVKVEEPQVLPVNEPEVEALGAEEIEPEIVATAAQLGMSVEQLIDMGKQYSTSLEELEDEDDDFFDPQAEDDITQI